MDTELRRLEREVLHDPSAFARLAIARERAGSGLVPWVTAALAQANGRRRVGEPTIDDIRNVVRALLKCPRAFAAELRSSSDRISIQTHSEDPCEDWSEIDDVCSNTRRPRQRGARRTFALAVRDGEFVTTGVTLVSPVSAHIFQAWDDEIGVQYRSARPAVSRLHEGRLELLPLLLAWSRRWAPDRYRTTLGVAEAFAATGRLPAFDRCLAGQVNTPCEHDEDSLISAEA